MQPKIGGKLLLKLNIGTRPIANKYREGKMKSTLKRKLIVRETVRREAHGISNALLEIHTIGSEYGCCTDPNGPSAFVTLFLFVAFPGSVRQQVLELGDTPRKKVAGFAVCVIACGVLARIR